MANELDSKLEENQGKQDNESPLEIKLKEGENVLKTGQTVYYKKGNQLMYYLAQLYNIPSKLMMWDRRISTRPKKETIDYVIKDLERNPNLKDVTVRLGHGAPLKDTYRMFTDPKIKKSVPLILRILGAPIVLASEIYASLVRADHYNPLTNTAVMYSDIPAIALHELGHADFFNSKKKSFMPYLIGLSGLGTLYMEYKASKYANDALPKYERYQTGRYLFPALGTYAGNYLKVGALAGGLIGLAVGIIYAAYHKTKYKKLKTKSQAIDQSSSPIPSGQKSHA